MERTEKKGVMKMKKTSTHGNDTGSILASSAVLVLLAGMLLITFNLYVIAYSSYANRQEQQFLQQINETD